MPSPPLDLASYSPATRDILGSFTSSNDQSPSAQLAQNRERRRITRQQRSGSLSSSAAGATTTVSSPESLGDDVWEDASLGLPRIRLNHDAASQISGSPKYQTEAGSPASTRVVPLPTINDEPTQDVEVPSAPSSAPHPPPPPAANSASPRRSSSPVAIAEIPPYRGPRTPSPSSSPVASPRPASEAGSIAGDSSSGGAPAKVKVVDGGLLARLKAQRAAKAQGAALPGGSAGSATPAAGSPATSPPPPPVLPSASSATSGSSAPFDLPISPTPTNFVSAPSVALAASQPATPAPRHPVVQELFGVETPITMSPQPIEEPDVEASPAATSVPSPGTKERILAEMRASNAAKAAAGGAAPNTTPPQVAVGAFPFPSTSDAVKPSSIRSTSTSSSKAEAKSPSPHKDAPVHPPSPTPVPPSPPSRNIEIIHDSTPAGRNAEMEAWLRGERQGGRIVDLDDWKHHSLSEIEERTERSSISTRHDNASSVAGSQGRGGGNHTRNSSPSSLPSLPPASPRAGRPLSTLSVSSSAGRQLADGSYQVGGAAASATSSPSKRKPASSIIETAARMFEGYEGSAIKQRFDEGTEELKRYAQRERDILATGGTLNGLATARAVPVESGSEAGSSTGAQPRAASPSRRPVSPELARRAAAFAVGEANSTSPARVFGGVGGGGETADQREERKRKARKEDREKRYIERMERESVRKLENMGMVVAPSEESVVLEPLIESEVYQSRPPTVWDLYRPVKPGDPPRPPPVLWEGTLSIPPPSLPSSAALADPSSWTTHYMVLTADTLEIRPTDATGPFTPRILLYVSEVRRLDDGLKASHGFKPFKVITRKGKEHLFACSKGADKVDWVMAFENGADFSLSTRRSVDSILNDGAPRVAPPSPSKRSSVASPRIVPPPAPTTAPETAFEAVKSATESLRRGISVKSSQSRSTEGYSSVGEGWRQPTPVASRPQSGDSLEMATRAMIASSDRQQEKERRRRRPVSPRPQSSDSLEMATQAMMATSDRQQEEERRRREPFPPRPQSSDSLEAAYEALRQQSDAAAELSKRPEVDYSYQGRPASLLSRETGSSAANNQHLQSKHDHRESQQGQRDLFGILRDRPLPPAPADMNVGPTPMPPQARSAPSSPLKSQLREQRRPNFPVSQSPYTHQRSRSELPHSPASATVDANGTPHRPIPVRPSSHSSRSASTRPSSSFVDILAPGPAKQLRDAIAGMTISTLQMEQNSEQQEEALRRVKTVLGGLIKEIDHLADLGETREAIERRWEVRDGLFETYEALKAVDRHAAARASARSRGFNGSIGSSLPSRSENSSNSKYEEEDLARIAYLTSKVLHTLDEVIGDGGDPRLNSMKGAGRAGSQPLPLTQSQLATPPQKQQSSPFKQAVPQAAPPLSADSSPKPRRKDDSKRQQQHMYPPVADDGATQTTRAAGHSASEHASWQDDLRRFEDEARLAEAHTSSQADTSIASPTRTFRARSLAADMLEGRAAKAATPDSIDLAIFQGEIDRRKDELLRARHASPYPQAEQEQTSKRARDATGRARRDPSAKGAAEPLTEMSHWSKTTSTDGQDTSGEPLSHPAQYEYAEPHQDYGGSHHAHLGGASASHPRPHLHRNAASEGYTAASVADYHLSTTDILRGLQDQVKTTGEHISTANRQRDQMGVFVNQLAQVMTDNRQSNDTQFERLISSIESLRMHLGELPEQLAGRLRGEIEAVGLGAGRGAQEGGIYFPPTPRAASAPLLHAEHNHEDQQQPVMDEDNGSNAGSTLVDHLEAQAQADAEQAAQGTTRGGVRFGINPLSSFAQLDKRMADSGDVDGKVGRKGSIGKKGMRGPRMPGMAGLKMWGGPTPVSSAEHAVRWGGGARALTVASDKAAVDKALKDDAESKKPKHGPVVEAIKTDEGLATALQSLAEGTGEKEIDAGTMALAVFEILQSMREISRKQKEAEQREKEEKLKNGGLSRRERAELEAKKEEIRRLEAIAGRVGGSEGKLDAALAALQSKSGEQDALLKKIADAMEASKKNVGKVEMDPALTEETKKLLGQVKSGVEDHVKDFRGQLTSEVQRMFKEVGKLRDEKKSLQTDIAELMSFQAKHGGSSSSGSAHAPAPAAAAPSSPLKPGMPTTGFFGPRAMK